MIRARARQPKPIARAGADDFRIGRRLARNDGVAKKKRDHQG
jgi:hypothetical protein